MAPKLFLALLLTVAAVANGTAADRTGHLVLVGGGPTPADVFTRTLGLSGGRSAIAVAMLRLRGIDAHNLKGGIQAWEKLAGLRP